MPQVHFTLNLEEIKNLIGVEVKDNISKSILTKVFNQLMEKERYEYLDNEAYQRDPNRMSYRNGYYDRDYTTRLVTLNL
ncbi:Transposase, Mutator family [Globicatella sulfidifaciens DSM 15739]|uniref:Transposase, Mutator family n=1 Tax=Globicatella sulfidifaciens DSM 15739 TaxID=1121925 RepID=A0A1T4JQR0_9LACT|nr:transposase [Globicatella sulfidifaciens]SJZ32530.1 Transposase, Mutator family [Globicatella sulfidifaciens DSM 15739]